MKYSFEQLRNAAQEINSLGFEPQIEVNNENIHQIHLETEICVKVYSLISYGFLKNKTLALDVFDNMMQGKLSKQTLCLIRYLLLNCTIREVGKDQLFEIRSN